MSFYTGSGPVRANKNPDGSASMSVSLGGNDGAPTVSEVTVGASATLLVATGTNRRSVLIVNNGSAVIFIAPDNTASPTHGIPIPQYGYFYDDSTLSAWFGVVATGSGDARILKVI